jgi:chlorobactene glucosyltransferase
VLLFLLDSLVTLYLLPLVRAMWDPRHGRLAVHPVSAPANGPLVSVIIPARNEERTIERCVRSLLAQRYPSFEILVLNDRSTDRTGQILERLAAEDARLRVLEGQPRPEGWVGKCWAAFQAANQARGAWLLFLDADTYHQPAALASSLAFAQAHGADLLSLLPRQELGTFWERALLPAIFGVILTFGGSPAEVNDPRNAAAKANGQFMLFRTEVYRRIGGHESVKDEMVDDFALARRVKGTGHRLLLAEGWCLVSTRMYRSLSEIWEGFSKNSYFEARREPGGVPSGVLAPWIVVVGVPMLLARLLRRARRGPSRSRWERATFLQSVLQCGLLVAFSVRVTRLLRLPLGWALTAPAGLLFLSLVVANAAVRLLSGRGVTWKGRSYGLGGPG